MASKPFKDEMDENVAPNKAPPISKAIPSKGNQDQPLRLGEKQVNNKPGFNKFEDRLGKRLAALLEGNGTKSLEPDSEEEDFAKKDDDIDVVKMEEAFLKRLEAILERVAPPEVVKKTKEDTEKGVEDELKNMDEVEEAD